LQSDACLLVAFLGEGRERAQAGLGAGDGGADVGCAIAVPVLERQVDAVDEHHRPLFDDDLDRETGVLDRCIRVERLTVRRPRLGVEPAYPASAHDGLVVTPRAVVALHTRKIPLEHETIEALVLDRESVESAEQRHTLEETARLPGGDLGAEVVRVDAAVPGDLDLVDHTAGEVARRADDRLGRAAPAAEEQHPDPRERRQQAQRCGPHVEPWPPDRRAFGAAIVAAEHARRSLPHRPP
jgi:hypothetical protein